MRTLFLMSWLALSFYGQTKDISGTWIAKRESPMGEMEMVCELKVINGKITGTQKLPFGDAPVIDGKVEGDTFEFTVETESFGTISKRTVIGKIIGDTLQFAPPMPQRPPGGMPGGGGPPPGMGSGGGANRPPGARTQGGGPGGPGGMFSNEPLTWRRGTATPSYRAASVNYRELTKVELPALKEVPRNNLAKTPPMGWNSWNKFRTNISDQTIREIADAMVASGMRDAGYIYLNIDDGWQWKRDEKGVLLPNPNFPDMKKLADYVHSKGLLLGIYSSPGPTTCGGYVGSYGHEEIDAKTWAKWGIDYLKYDWCSASRIWKDEDMPAVYQRMGEALRQAGRPIVYSLCQYGRANVGEWGPKVGGNLWRTTFDIRDQWESMEGIGFSQNDWAKFAAPGHWNDPDMLEVGNGRMTTEEYRTHFSLWALLAAPLIAGNDLRSMTKEVKEILLNEEVIAINQDKLGKPATRLSQPGETEVWAKPLNKGAYAVGFFNRGAKEAVVGVKWTAFNMRGKLKVRDLWKHASLGEWTDNFSIAVPSHGVVLLRVTQ